jgi:hypothetical protein
MAGDTLTRAQFSRTGRHPTGRLFAAGSIGRSCPAVRPAPVVDPCAIAIAPTSGLCRILRAAIGVRRWPGRGFAVGQPCVASHANLAMS